MAGQFNRNLVATLVVHGLTILLQLWYTRFLLHTLGTEIYGLIPLALSLVSYLGLITMSVNAGVARHVTVALGEGNTKRAGQVLGISLKSIVILLIPIGLLGAGLTWQLPHVIQVPAGVESQARLFFGLVLAGFLLTLLSAPHSVATFATNRLDLRAAMSGCGVLIRVIGAWLLFHYVAARLISVGVAVVGAALFTLTAAVKLQRYLMPNIQPRLDTWDAQVFKDMVFTGGWITVTMMGAILFLNIDLIVINRLLGPHEAGLYAPVLQIAAGLRAVGALLGGLFAPTLMLLFGRQDVAGIAAYSRRAVRFLGLSLGIPIGLVCGFAPEILGAWLSPAFAERWPYVLLLVGSLALNIPAQPLFQIQVAANRVRMPALVTLASGIANLVLAVVLCRALGALGVALAGTLLLSLKNVLFTPLYNAAILRIPCWQAFGGLLTSVAASLLVGTVAYVVRHWIPIDGALLLLVGIPLTTLTAAPLIWFGLMQSSERREVWQRVPRFRSASASQ